MNSNLTNAAKNNAFLNSLIIKIKQFSGSKLVVYYIEEFQIPMSSKRLAIYNDYNHFN